MTLIQQFRYFPVLGVLATSVNTFAADVDKTLDWIPDGDLEVSITSGQLEIRGWNKDQVKLTGDFSGDDDRLVFKRSGKNIKLELRDENSGWWGRGSHSNVDFVMFAPFNSDLEIDGTSLRIEVAKISGNLDINSISGSVSIDGDTKGSGDIRADIETVSGDIDIENASGMIRLRTVSGDINTDVAASTFDAKSVSGDIEGAIGATEYASLLSVSGDIDVELRLKTDGRIEGQTVSGNLELKFNDRVNADFELNTGPGGNISNRVSDDKPDDNNRWGQELNFTINDGDGSVNLETMSGTIKLR